MEEGWISLFERKIFFPPFWLSATIDKFRNLVSFLIVSSIFIGIINLLLIYFCFLLLGLALNLYILLAAFFLTFSIYNLNKLTDIAEDLVNAPERAEYVIGKEKVILCFFDYRIYICFIAWDINKHPVCAYFTLPLFYRTYL